MSRYGSQWASDRRRPPVHRSEGPIPLTKRPAQRRALQARGQLVLLDQATANPGGRPKVIVDIVNESDRPDGNSRQRESTAGRLDPADRLDRGPRAAMGGAHPLLSPWGDS